MPASMLARRQREENQHAAWELYCGGLTGKAIAKQLGVSVAAVDKYIAAARKDHPSKKLDEGDRFAEAHTVMRQAAVLLRAELAEVKARGEDVTRVLGLVSCHSDRMARFLTRQNAVAAVEVNNVDVFSTSLWSSLLGANHQPAMADAAAIEALPPTTGPLEVVVTAENAD